MAAYFHGNSSEIGGDGATGDGLQTLILMNPGYMGYSDGNQHTPPPHGGNFVFLNHNSHGSSSPHASLSQDQHHFVGIPLQGGAVADTSPNSGHEQQDVSAPHSFLPPRIHYSLYNLPVDLGPTPDMAGTPQAQRISLSLSSLQSPPPNGSFHAERPDSVQPQRQLSPARGDAYGFRILWGTPSPASGITTGVGLVQSVLPSSKFLKAAQDLLHEVVNVGRVAKGIPDPSVDASALALMSGEGHSGRESSEKRGPEPNLTTPERQEIQMKKSKLVNMLDEVEQRYRQHHQQMQMVVSWFEQEAGVGSAETYTAAALQTISKQFRCLKDAILSQIRAAGRRLGEDGTRLRHADNQIRQQRALQQLGMIQHNPWRPQRGLPERSVSVLRAWLFEHFLHPYPKDSDKTMLAKQTGLTRSQVSNWFINARVRLWKPMVEEMYTEEMKAHHDKNASHDRKTNNTNTKIEHDDLTPNNTEQEHHDTNPPPPLIPISSPSGPTSVLHHMPSEIDRPKKLRFGPNMGRAGYGLMDGPTNFVSGFGGYPMGELGGLYPGNGVSLTLGLPLYEAHQTLLQASNERMAMQMGEGGHPTNVYESISAQDRKMFAAQLLPDFVA